MKATAKKTYTPFDVEGINGIKKIYQEYFSKHKCSALLNLLNQYSVADALMVSGNSTVILEYKRRTMSLTQFDTVLLEKIKYDSLRQASQLFNADVFYISDYDDGTLIYQLDFKKEMNIDHMNSPASNGSNYLVRKPMYHLPVIDADIVIGKKTWERASREQVAEYIRRKKLE